MTKSILVALEEFFAVEWNDYRLVKPKNTTYKRVGPSTLPNLFTTTDIGFGIGYFRDSK